MSEQTSLKAPEIDFGSPALTRRRSLRALKDRVAATSVGIGGSSVIFAITLIFFYLLYEVFPLFKGASVEQGATYPVPAVEAGPSLQIFVEEQVEKGIRLTASGDVVFFSVTDGQVLGRQRLPIPQDVTVTAQGQAGTGSDVFALGLNDGGLLVVRQAFKVSYPDGVRQITPQIEYPYGETVIRLSDDASALRHVAIRDGRDALFIVAADTEGRLFSRLLEKKKNFLSGEITLTPQDVVMPAVSEAITHVLVEPDTRWLYVVLESGTLEMYDLRDRQQPRLNQRVNLVEKGARVSSVDWLLGGISLIVGDSKGGLAQWFPVRDADNNYALTQIRRFEHAASPIVSVQSEHRRKGFLALDAAGHLAIYNSTANNRVVQEKVTDGALAASVIAPRANAFLQETADGRMQLWNIDNKHPEVSWSSLWGKVWYEGYSEPKYIWQSSAANNDFEPKYSLAPLAFGTLKAAFYAMLVAMPLAICGAIYTAYFMSPGLRKKVKPAIELMEALPTVILGFLAGLFLAPFIESHLPGVFAVLLLMPLGVLLFGFVWANLPERIRHWVPDGWDPVLLVPVILIIGWLSFTFSGDVEILLFDGNMRGWLTNDLGITYDQRNAIVVGAAMGFAVIPTIFSITEDAIFSVPKHLTMGSLALGATPWQTLALVVLPTASPGIFSAVMIGLGRAVGETMIVLMATGNTAIMDFNIFEGMRTLSANIAVEMPESAVGSTHYRILFLAAFVLFLFTFVVNTAAEFVRQRLRNKYSVI